MYALLFGFEWTSACEAAFEKLNKTLVSTPFLRAPNSNFVFHMHIDASRFSIGCILAQSREKHMEFLISYASRQLNAIEKNCTTTECEGLCH